MTVINVVTKISLDDVTSKTLLKNKCMLIYALFPHSFLVTVAQIIIEIGQEFIELQSNIDLLRFMAHSVYFMLPRAQ